MSSDSQSKAVPLHTAAWRAFNERHYADALAICKELTTGFPAFAHGWNVSSQVLLALKQPERALQGATQAAHIDPHDPAHEVQRAYCLLALGRQADAAAAVERAGELPCDHPAVIDNLGTLLSLTGQQQKAMKAFEKAVSLRPRDPHFRFNLAVAQQSLGYLQEAECEFDRLIELNPLDCQAYLHRSRLRRQKADDNHIDELVSLATSAEVPWRGKVTLQYALAKEYEDLGEYDLSFDALSIGAALRRKHLDYDVNKDVEIMHAIENKHTEAFCNARNGGYTTSEPIFVVGLPRTGTTLVERIISAHTEVFAAGELNGFAASAIAQASALKGGSAPSASELLDLSLSFDFGRLGRDYLESTRPGTGHTARFVDKLPINFLYCGLIARALPNAKIVHVRRNPMDACYAIFKTLFKQAYPFSYDLIELGMYHRAYRSLMSHWSKVLSDRLFHVDYEELVDDQEAVSRRLFDYLELGWDDEVLDFHTQAAPSQTASLAQVRQPIYSSSVGKWRNFQRHLEPLRRTLEVPQLQT